MATRTIKPHYAPDSAAATFDDDSDKRMVDVWHEMAERLRAEGDTAENNELVRKYTGLGGLWRRLFPDEDDARTAGDTAKMNSGPFTRSYGP